MRYELVGHRYGEMHHTPAGYVSTSHVDGAAELTEKQKEYLESVGYTLVAVEEQENILESWQQDLLNDIKPSSKHIRKFNKNYNVEVEK